jgi:hypothetical protein
MMMPVVRRGQITIDRTVLVDEAVGVDFIAHLSTRLAPAKLATLLEAGVPIDANLPTINNLQVEAVHRLLCLITGGVLDEAEPARGLLSLVEPHDEADYLAELREELH